MAMKENACISMAVVDDTKEDRDSLKEMLARYFAGKNVSGSTKEFCSGEEFLYHYRPGQYQVIFFDVYMGGITGMETAQAVYRTDPEVRLIFFTSSSDCAVDSYKVNAAYYLMKPLDYAELSRALDRLFGEAVTDGPGLSVTLKGGASGKIPFKDILYVDCVSRMVNVHTRKKTIAVSDRFQDVSECLAGDSRFLCCNRGIYVNMDWIQEMRGPDLTLVTGECLPVRIRGRGDVKKEYLTYMLRNLRG